MSLKWSAYALNTFIAPNYSGFTQADIPDLTGEFPQASHWLGNHLLNTILRGSFAPGFRQAALGFLRRMSQAFAGYRKARRLTMSYLALGSPHDGRILDYYAAVNAWENVMLQLAMGMDLARWMIRPENVFEKNDGSPEQRITSIANQVKHVTSCIESGQCTERDTLPLWLSNDGIESFDNIRISWVELGEVLRDFAKFSDRLQDPLNFTQQAMESPSGSEPG